MRRAPRQTERSIQAAGVKLLRALGAEVYVLGTTRRRGDHPGTMQTPGLPDVLAFLPVTLIGTSHSSFEINHRLLVWEAKAPDGKLRPEQRRFRELCVDAAIDHVAGTHDALIQWLIGHGYLRPDQVAAHHTEGR